MNLQLSNPGLCVFVFSALTLLVECQKCKKHSSEISKMFFGALLVLLANPGNILKIVVCVVDICGIVLMLKLLIKMSIIVHLPAI